MVSFLSLISLVGSYSWSCKNSAFVDPKLEVVVDESGSMEETRTRIGKSTVHNIRPEILVSRFPNWDGKIRLSLMRDVNQVKKHSTSIFYTYKYPFSCVPLSGVWTRREILDGTCSRYYEARSKAKEKGRQALDLFDSSVGCSKMYDLGPLYLFDSGLVDFAFTYFYLGVGLVEVEEAEEGLGCSKKSYPLQENDVTCADKILRTFEAFGAQEMSKREDINELSEKPDIRELSKASKNIITSPPSASATPIEKNKKKKKANRYSSPDSSSCSAPTEKKKRKKRARSPDLRKDLWQDLL